MAFIGKNVIENLTTAMYEHLHIVFREYIQNSADSIDKAISMGIVKANEAEITIEINEKEESIIIKDNGTGISAKDFKGIMSSIADSKKDSSSNKGFRGIGRLGGISACQTLIFECSYYGETKKSSVIWDAKRIKEILNDNDNNPDASTLVDETTTYHEETCGYEEHFFVVKMLGIERNARNLLKIDKVKNYLQAVAPLPFSPGFLFQKKIKDFASQNNFSLDEYNVFVNGDRLYKPYTAKFYETKGDQKIEYDELIDVKFEIIRGNVDNILAWMWYGISRFEKAIPVCNSMRGIRIRKGNIQIGNEETFFSQGLFKESRGYQYFVGEVHAISSDLRPNARRDYFNKNGACKDFEDALRPLLHEEFYKIYHDANNEKNAYKKIRELHNAREVYGQKTQNGFVSDEEKKRLEEDIKQKEEKAEKAKKKIANRKKQGTSETIAQVCIAIKEKYEIASTETTSDDTSSTDKALTSAKKDNSSDVIPTPIKEEQTNMEVDDKRNAEEDSIADEASDITSAIGDSSQTRYISDELTNFTNDERRVIQRIYSIIQAKLPPDFSDILIKSIQEELKK